MPCLCLACPALLDRADDETHLEHVLQVMREDVRLHLLVVFVLQSQVGVHQRQLSGGPHDPHYPPKSSQKGF